MNTDMRAALRLLGFRAYESHLSRIRGRVETVIRVDYEDSYAYAMMRPYALTDPVYVFECKRKGRILWGEIGTPTGAGTRYRTLADAIVDLYEPVEGEPLPDALRPVMHILEQRATTDLRRQGIDVPKSNDSR